MGQQYLPVDPVPVNYLDHLFNQEYGCPTLANALSLFKKNVWKPFQAELP